MATAVVIAGSIAATAAAGATTGVLATAVIGSITVGTLVGAAIAVGTPLLAQALAGTPSAAELPGSPGLDPAAVTTQVASAARRWRLIGETKTAGAFLAYDASDENELWQLIAVSCSRIDSIVEHRLDGRVVTLDADGWVTSPARWAGRVQIKVKLGGHTTTFPQLVEALPYWTDAHVGRGIAQVLIRQLPVEPGRVQKVYPRRRLQWTGVVRGDPDIWDPRDDSVGWSENAALHLLRYLMLSPLDGGCGVPVDRINLASFRRAATLSDQVVELKGGGSQPRWRVGGVIEHAQDRREALGEFLKALDGDLRFDRQGRWALRLSPGEHTVRLGEDDVLALEIGPGTPAYERVTRVAPVIRSAQHGYREITVPPRTRPGLAGETVRQVALPLKLVQWHAQAQRIAKRRVQREWPDYAATATITLSAARRVQALGSVLLDLSAAPPVGRWLVQRVRKDLAAQTATLELVSLPGGYELWDAEDEAPPDFATVGDGDADLVAAPGGVTVVATVVNLDGSQGNGLRVAWAPVADVSLAAEVQVAEAGTDEWSSAGLAPARVGRLSTGVLYRGRDYDVRVRFVGGPDGAATDWTLVEATEVAAVGTQPDAPTGLSATVDGAAVTLSATAPASGPVERIQFRWAPVDDFAQSTFFGVSAADNGDAVQATRASVAPGTYYGWARARSAADVDGSPTASVSFTVS